jgi:hypothetical protein
MRQLMRERKVFLHGQALHEVCALKHDAQIRPAPHVQFAIGGSSQVASRNAKRAFPRAKQSAKQVEERRFSGTAVPKQEHPFTCSTGEIGEVHLGTGASVAELDALCLDHASKVRRRMV